jgi:predicted metal-dependent phosphoesterase TrpH
MNNTSDLHLHTLVSDGTATPLEMLQAAKEAGVGTVSFTDHDALGAYRHFGDVFAQAKELGIGLVTGIELDSDCRRREVHLLGYGFKLDDPALNRHLNLNRNFRKRRVTEQLAIINQYFGRKVVDPKKVFLPNRDTLMKPHLVHAMLAQGLFSEYREAAKWLSEVARVPVHVPKLPLADAIRLIRAAGGKAVLAHPGYMVRESDISLAAFLEEFVPLGLAGLEVDYPYYQEKEPGPPFPDLASEQAMIAELRSLAERFNLEMTGGSDAHDTEAVKAFAQRPPGSIIQIDQFLSEISH